MSGGGKGSQDVIVGHWYSLGMHLVFAHVLDRITKIGVGERAVWSGNASTNTTLQIDQPELFGGKDREGGVVGPVQVAFGRTDQPVNDYLQAVIGGGPTPAYRGVTALILGAMQTQYTSAWARGAGYGLIGRNAVEYSMPQAAGPAIPAPVRVAANNPYLKPWWIEAQRLPDASVADVLEVPAGIGSYDANPSHIIYECLASIEWGIGADVAEIDVPSFREAAQTLLDEGFGLSIVWSDIPRVQDFIDEVCRHIHAASYVDPATGKHSLRLLRPDYDIGDLPVLSPANISTVERFERPSPGELVNQVTVNYIDRENKARTVTVQDIAALELVGGAPNATALEFPGIAEAELATRVAMRELRTLSRPLARATIIATRAVAGLTYGEPFVLDWPDAGVAGLVMRVGKISYGSPQQSHITIEAVEDIYTMPETAYVADDTTAWSYPVSAPEAAPQRYLMEAPWLVLVEQFVGEYEAAQGALDPDGGFVIAFYTRPSDDAVSADVRMSVAGSAYASVGSDLFCATATLAADLYPDETDLTFATDADLGNVVINSWAVITGGTRPEIVRVDEMTGVDGVIHITVARGVLDTTPQPLHPAGARVWFFGRGGVFAAQEFVLGTTVSVKVLPRTGRGKLAESSAPVDTITITARHTRPYPPGNFKVNGGMFTAVVAASDDLVLTWAHRNRLSQTAGIIDQAAASIGPEPGVTYTVRVYDEITNALLHTESGISGTTWTWTAAAEALAGGLRSRLRIEAEAVRDTVTSYQPQIRIVERAGWGLTYGKHYGGIT